MRIVPWNRADLNQVDTLPVAIMSLPDQITRRERLKSRGLPIDWVENFWPATDFRSARAEDLNRIVNLDEYASFTGEPFRAAVVGCATTHHNLAKWLASTNFPMLFVLEDDVIPAVRDLADRIIWAAGRLEALATGGDAFICHLGVRPEQLDQSLRRPVNSSSPENNEGRLWLHVDPRPTIWRAHAYLITRAAAMRTLDRETRLLSVADDWIRRRNLGLIDEIYVAEPRIFTQDELIPSTLGTPPISIPQPMQEVRYKNIFASIKFRIKMRLARHQHMKPISI